MVASIRQPINIKTFLTPGQRFATSDAVGASSQGLLTVARLVTDQLGLLHVTLRDERGREISAFAEQVEAAIAEGHLIPASTTVGVA